MCSCCNPFFRALIQKTETDTRPAWEKVPQPYRSNFSHSTLAALSKFPSDWPELQYVPVAAATVPTNDEDNYMVTSAPSLKSRLQSPSTASSPAAPLLD